jgi:GNAT superfamily N-acetyltransferase
MADRRDDPIHLRLAEIGDAAALAALSAELGYPRSVTDISTALRELLAAPDKLVMIATGADGQPLGWIAAERRVMLETGASAEITGLVVAAAARRRGIAGRLLAAAERWAATQGLRALRVRSNVTRTESHPFYLGQGYAQKKTQHVYEKILPGDVSVAGTK